MAFADVAIEGATYRTTFSYRVPPSVAAQAGSAVWAPFGKRVARGIVVRLSEKPGFPDVRDLIDLIAAEPVVSAVQIQLATWIADHYVCAPFAALAPFLPSDLGRRIVTLVRPTNAQATGIDGDIRRVLSSVRRRNGVSQDDLEARLRDVDVPAAIETLLRRGLVTTQQSLARPISGPRREKWVSLVGDPPAEPTPKQAAVVATLADGPRRLAEIGSIAAVRALVAAGTVTIEDRTVRRDPLAALATGETATVVPNTAQQLAIETIVDALGTPAAFLLFGVTGSGKTEVYLRAIRAVLDRGQQAIVLVPEIALTPQTVSRFSSRFPGQVALIHSGLRGGEHYDEWQRIQSGEARIVVGSRSALFAPVVALGIIIVDEEHEWSYKQAEPPPRYHARDTALEYGRLAGVPVVLGSATPDTTTFQAAADGRLRLLELPERAGGAMPQVSVIDLRAELKAGNRSIFSRALVEAIGTALARGEQTILFLNRRGTASVVLCRDCGYTARCGRCDTILTYHAVSEQLVCHSCNARQPSPSFCPVCGGSRIRYLGIGTQRVAEDAERLFPSARVARLDSDVRGGRKAYDTVLRAFAAGEADILVGTQVIAKGLDLPNVSLVGVINADVGLYLPDYRAGERTFQLLTQVAGRAGRRGGGSTIIQTYSPDHYVVQAAARQDYRQFFDREIGYRREQRYPPFARLVRLLYAHRNDAVAERETTRFRGILAESRAAIGHAIDILGPAPAYFRRIRGRYRWQILLRGNDLDPLLSTLRIPPGWTIDVDPLTLV